MEPVLQDALPYAPWTDPVGRKLPGTRAATDDAWFVMDEAFAGQMVLRDRLVAEERDRVIACLPRARAAAGELLELALARVGGMSGYAVGASEVMRPDGIVVPVDRGDPMAVLARLGQPDLCILQSGESEHLLTAAALCFPAGWTLSEKLGRPMTRIHRPVERYDVAIAGRIQRMFDNLKPGLPIWRANANAAHDATLFRPLREADPRPQVQPDPPYLRSERQVLFRLPATGAIVFSIHTILVKKEALTPDQAAALREHPVHMF